MSSLRRFLLYFAQENIEFRYPEIKSLIQLFNLEIKLPNSFGETPYWILDDVDEQDVRKIASRSVSLRYIVEVFSSGKNYKSFHENLKNFSISDLSKKYASADSSFRITVDTYNKRIEHAEKIQRIESLDYIDYKGKIDLKNPENNFIYFEYWGLDPTNVPEEPVEIIFGRWISDGQRDITKSISLKTRKFIGNTSMNPLLSLLMANQGLCDKNHIVFDPFAGTGSILIAAAKFGSFVIGSDIDYLMLHGRTKPSRVRQKVREEDENIKSNMIQYNLQHLYVDIFVSDFSNCPLNDAIEFDSIITDPPYGIREKMAQVVPKEGGRKSTVLTEDAKHYPSTSNYSINSMYGDLLNFAAKHLKLHGRLVCWFPVNRDDYHEELLPRHSAFQIIANSEQKLNGDATRRLLTYEKVKESGEIVDVDALETFDFRQKYFTQATNIKEKRLATHHRNIIEAQKRGKIIENLAERKKLSNKKFHLDNEHSDK
ncbi:CLUMA_CG001780, isoform A [Clunio marinus]|uniref:tRNA (guanine(10)-N(2))-methyltransferase TRMT11 n=1 Tax=Clunio marinus TaxID=568069 RepID=A0A1J1HKC6_9DIPT|nr:CLUMA_CG001780, isoform A [Clunio marinus]